MLSWTERRKIIYLIGTLAVLFVLIYVPFLLFWYEKPTCFDGKQNGDEVGIDCGGSCSQLCSNEVERPIVLWTRVFRVVPGVYSAVAYVENPNPTSEAPAVPYEFTFYDEGGNVVHTTTGATFIPQGSRFAVFEGAIPFSDTIPTRATFEIDATSSWRSGTFSSSDIVVKNKALLREATAPRIEATVTNESREYIEEAELVAIVYDALGKAVHSSRTIVEDLSPRETLRATFNWPMPFETSVSVCESPVDVALLIDRSGSMKEDNEDPPEPLTSVKEAAHAFVDALGEEDRVAIVSFGTDTTSHVSSLLTFDKENIKQSIDEITIGATTSSFTNMGGGIIQVLSIFDSVSQRPDTRRAMVLLTDGVPTAPDDEEDPEELTRVSARHALDDGINIYAIGLGSGVNRAFLESLVSDPSSYRGAARSDDLRAIYTSIATEICQKKPAVIEIIPKPTPRTAL